MVSEYPKFIVGSCVDSKSIGNCLAEIVFDLEAASGLFVGSCVDLRPTFELLKESNLME